MTPEIVTATWEMFKEDIKRIKEDIGHLVADMEQCDGIYGVPAGGLPLAVKLKNLTGLPLLMSPTKSCIIIDDIFDSGDTLRPLWHRYCNEGKSKMLVWYINKDREVEVEDKHILWYRSKNADQWALFEMWE